MHRNRARASRRAPVRHREARRDVRDTRRDVRDTRRDVRDVRAARDVRDVRRDAAWRRVGRAAYITSLTDCVDHRTFDADGVTYYYCDDVWYERVVQDGEVVYTVTDDPEGS